MNELPNFKCNLAPQINKIRYTAIELGLKLKILGTIQPRISLITDFTLWTMSVSSVCCHILFETGTVWS